MAIDFDKAPEEQVIEETGPVLDRPLHFEDDEVEDDNGYDEGFVTDDLGAADDTVEAVDGEWLSQ